MSDGAVVEFQGDSRQIYSFVGLAVVWLALCVLYLARGAKVVLGIIFAGIALFWGLLALATGVRRPLVKITQDNLAYRVGPLHSLKVVPLSSVLTLSRKRGSLIELTLASGKGRRLRLGFFSHSDRELIVAALRERIGR